MKKAPKRKMRNTTPITKPIVGKGSSMQSPKPMAKGGTVTKVKIVDEPVNVKISEPEYDDRPTISFYETQLPEINTLSLNDKVTLCIEVELNSIRIEDYGKHKGLSCAYFKVNKVGIDSDAE